MNSSPTLAEPFRPALVLGLAASATALALKRPVLPWGLAAFGVAYLGSLAFGSASLRTGTRG